MYERFYGLKERAFNLTPDPSFLFLNQRSKDALDHILYGIERREGFAVIVGDVGTGKTTLCWALLERLEQKNVRTALIQNPMLSETEILKAILQDLGARPETAPRDSAAGLEVFDTSWMHGMSKKELIDRLNAFLAKRAREDVFTVLIIDESQNLSLNMLEQLRLLSNLETAKKKLLQIIFAGQLELDQKLNLPMLRQLNQRISVRFETKTLSREDSERYIRHRLAMAGGAPKLQFGRGALNAVWRHSKGYPRLINLICDRALLAGYSERSLVITRKLVRKAVLGLQGKEDVSVRMLPRWVGKLIPFFAPLLLLMPGLFVQPWKGVGLIEVSPSTLPYSPASAASLVSKPATCPEKPVQNSPVTASKPAEPASQPAHQSQSGPPISGNALARKGSPPSDSNDSGVEFFLQVHSFRKDAQAESALNPLRHSGYPAYIKFVGDGTDSGWFAVFVGPFDDLGTAKEKVAELREQGLTPIIRQQGTR